MSLHETWRTRLYWSGLSDGLLIEEFPAIRMSRSQGVGKRLIDGIIVLGEDRRIQAGGRFDLRGREIIVVQTKASRLGMYLMGQAFFSRDIMRRYEPASIKTVAICAKGDPEMETLCAVYEIEVVVIPDSDRPSDIGEPR